MSPTRTRRSLLALAVVGGAWQARGDDPAPMPVAPAAPAAVSVEAEARQMVRVIRPHMRVEVEFAERACGLSAEQRARLGRGCEEALAKVARDVAVARIAAGRGEWWDAGPDGTALVRERFPAALRAVATAEQVARYAEEERLREDDRRRGVVAIVVDRLDGTLSLVAGQREAIARALLEGWGDDWAPGPEAFVDDDPAVPPEVPDRLVLPTLEPGQAALWKATEKRKPVASLNRFRPFPDARPLVAEAPR